MGEAMTRFTISSSRGELIASLDDWLRYAPPKKREKHWSPGRSALELARAWLNDGCRPVVPAEILELLESDPRTASFEAQLAIPELVTRLDAFGGEHRNHDLVVVGSAAGGRTSLAIEGKADEAFGSATVLGYLVASERRERERIRRGYGRPSNVPARIDQLCRSLFGPPPDGFDRVHPLARPLRYQLIAALAGALIEAEARACQQVALIVHEFISTADTDRNGTGTDPKKVERNAQALDALARAFAGAQATVLPGQLIGPFYARGGGRVPGDLPFFIGKARRVLG